MPRLDLASGGDGATLSGGPWLALRAGLLALIGACAVAAGAFLLVHGTGRAPQDSSSLLATRARERVDARLALAGVRAASAPMLDAAARAGSPPLGTTPVVPDPHVLSAADLTTLAAGTSLYQPPRYLADAYAAVGARFGLPWRLLAAVEWLRGGDVEALAGADSRAARIASAQASSDARGAVDARVLARAAAAAAQPSASLVSDARRLVAAGAVRGPAGAIATLVRGTDTSVSAVMTLAQSIAPVTSGVASPVAKVDAMLGEAQLLNGLPYIWGGGHTDPAWLVGAGYDCSGFVSEVLHSGGYLTSPDTTQTLPGSAGIVNGPGRYVTIYDRTIATVKVWVKRKKIVTIRQAVNPASVGVHVDTGRHANARSAVSIALPRWVGQWRTIRLTKLVPSLDNSNNDEHVIIDIAGQWWESGGSTGDGGAAMVHQMTTPSPAYLKSFNRVLHPQGL